MWTLQRLLALSEPRSLSFAWCEPAAVEESFPVIFRPAFGGKECQGASLQAEMCSTQVWQLIASSELFS